MSARVGRAFRWTATLRGVRQQARSNLDSIGASWTTPALRNLIARLGMAATLLTILLPPLGFAAVEFLDFRKRAVEHASLAARQIEIQLIRDRAVASPAEAAADVLHAIRADSAVIGGWLTDKGGAMLMFTGEPSWWPEIRRSAAIDSRSFQGDLHVAVSTRALWIGTFWVAAVFLLLGLVTHVCFTRWPLAALDTASRSLEANQAELQRQKAEVETQNVRLDAAVNNMPIGLVMFDPGKRLIVGNEPYRQMYGLPHEVMRRGTHLREMLEHRLEAGSEEGADREAYIQRILKLVEQKETSTRVVALGNGRIVNIIHHPIPSGGWIGTHEDITEREKLNAQLKEQNELLRSKQQQLDAAVSNMAQGLAMFDADLRVVIANNRYAEIYGLKPDQVAPGTTLHRIVEHRIMNGDFSGKTPDEVVKQLQNRVVGHKAAQYINDLDDGRVISVSIQPMPDGGYVSTHQDVTEERRAEARIAHLAMHDALTDLPNRILLRKRLEEAVDGVRRGGGGLAALMLDLDRFKEVNDSLGHPVGDALLKVVSERLKDCVREDDTIGRLGGDEFIILAQVDNGAGEASVLARRIGATIAAPFALDGYQVNVGTSIGIALVPEDSSDPDDLLKKADMALYRAKSEGRGTHRFFVPEMGERMEARHVLDRDLRRALAEGEFELYYQPLVNLERQEICALEALLRWNHPERGRVSPLDFIPLAEDTGLIIPIGEWVLRQACAEAAAWPRDVRVAVNVSPVQLRGGDFLEMLADVFISTGLAPDRLEVEITESVVLEDGNGAFETISRLHGMGVRIALDDFGTGFSSLSNLRKFPFDKIKIDRSFVKDLSRGKRDAVAIVRAVAQLGMALGIATAAEGVETEEQLSHVRSEGCTEAQGHHICEPCPARVIHQMFARDGKRMRTASAA